MPTSAKISSPRWLKNRNSTSTEKREARNGLRDIFSRSARACPSRTFRCLKQDVRDSQDFQEGAPVHRRQLRWREEIFRFSNKLGSHFQVASRPALPLEPAVFGGERLPRGERKRKPLILLILIQKVAGRRTSRRPRRNGNRIRRCCPIGSPYVHAKAR